MLFLAAGRLFFLKKSGSCEHVFGREVLRTVLKIVFERMKKFLSTGAAEFGF